MRLDRQVKRRFLRGLSTGWRARTLLKATGSLQMWRAMMGVALRGEGPADGQAWTAEERSKGVPARQWGVGLDSGKAPA